MSDQPARPRRRFEATVTVGADDLKSLTHAMRDVASTLDGDGCHGYLSAGPTSSSKVEISEDETVTHDSYFRALDSYLDRKPTEKRGIIA